MGLDTVEILLAAQDAFDVKISDDAAAGCRTVGDLNQCIAQLVADRATTASGRPVKAEPELTWPLLVPIIVKTTGVRLEKVRPEAKWREDLGIN